MPETQSISRPKFIVDKCSLTIQYDNDNSICLRIGEFEADITEKKCCSDISTCMTIKEFVDKFCNHDLQELQNINMSYYWTNCDDYGGFFVQNGIFNICVTASDHVVFNGKFPITEQFHLSLVKMIKDVCNIWTDINNYKNLNNRHKKLCDPQLIRG